MVWSPENDAMYCPYCDGKDCETQSGNDSLTSCASCGGEIIINDLASSSRCPYCGNYLVFDSRVTDKYKPDSIIPFKISKKAAVEAMDKEFAKRTFAPTSFLSEKTLESMNGFYVPFFMYDYDVLSEYEGTGTKVKSWSSGNYDYTETSYYDVRRKMTVSYDNVPVDASYAMDDSTMDLMEPFDYKKLCEFDPKYLSGFFGEVYNDTADAFEERAKFKVSSSVTSFMRNSLSSYSSLRSTVDKTTLTSGKIDYSLLPIWLYVYKYAGKLYRFYVNGQNGKVVGKTPVSLLKVFAYSLTVGGFVFGLFAFIFRILEVIV